MSNIYEKPNWVMTRFFNQIENTPETIERKTFCASPKGSSTGFKIMITVFTVPEFPKTNYLKTQEFHILDANYFPKHNNDLVFWGNPPTIIPTVNGSRN